MTSPTSADAILVLGTGNPKKRIELEALLAPLGFCLKTLADYPNAIEVEEDRNTFAGNAEKKATEQAQHINQWVLGEDSGIVVDALDGRPGVYSARYAGEDSNDEANNAKLLAELGDLPPNQRTAHYVCHAVISDPQGKVRLRCEGICRGRIRHEPIGDGGFGYDPLFEVWEYHRTFGEMGSTIKQAISHRGRALRKLATELRLLRREWTGSSVD